MPRSEPIKAVRGVRDILPAEMPVWRAAQAGAAAVARRYGYEEIITPIIEHAELIERVGEDTDAVAKELYRFDDRAVIALYSNTSAKKELPAFEITGAGVLAKFLAADMDDLETECRQRSPEDLEVVIANAAP